MIEHRRTLEVDYFIEWAIREGSTEEEAQHCYNNFLFGYEAWEDGELLGIAYATIREGVYTLDGHNRTNNIFGACKLARKVLDELKDYTDKVFTWHDIDQPSVTALTKRLGFMPIEVHDGQVFLRLEI